MTKDASLLFFSFAFFYRDDARMMMSQKRVNIRHKFVT